ncbi:MAG: hypothetical protein IIT48_04385, partial [Lachnospiraceae bacterium]|nr:hypothetical protein [Lachnospiraceae bacterium]
KEPELKDVEGEKPKVSKVDKDAEVTSKAGKITKGASKVDKPAKIASEGDNISKTPRMEKSVYIPKDENGKQISLKKQRLMGQDIPLPDKRANGRPHTVLGGKVSSKTGEVYRQSATFNGGSWPTANAHSNPHQHVFMYDFDNRYWHRSDQEILN